MPTPRAFLLLVLFMAVAVPPMAAAQSAPPGTVYEDVLITFRHPPGPLQQAAVDEADGSIKYVFDLIPTIAARVPQNSVWRIMMHPDVLLVEPDSLVYASATPNDPDYATMWGLNNTGQTGGVADADIDAPEAWDVTKGSSSVVIAVVDTGVQVAPGFAGDVVTHPDLAANLWTNPGEVAGNNVDDDGNGFVDDVHGWNFYDDAAWLFYSENEDAHATHVSGTIAAAGNNGIGVTGINWQARIMVLKFLGPGGAGNTSDAIAAIQYAKAKGAKVINASWGGGPFSSAMKSAIEAFGGVFVAAAGNGGSDQIGDNTDTDPEYPGAYNSPNIISVAATDHSDSLAGFSNYGATTVDLGAPGVSILSTVPLSGYNRYSGTSMATPHVSGVAGLVLSLSPGLTAAQVKAQILGAVDPVPALSGRTVSGGRVNAAKAVGTTPPPPPPPPTSNLIALAQSDMFVQATVYGNYGSTHTNNNRYEVFVEKESTQSDVLRRYSTMEHKWTFTVTPGTAMRFYVQARRPDNTDADNFRFSYSTDNKQFYSLLTVSSATKTLYSAPMPATLSGKVYVRVRDTNRTAGKLSLDWLYVDHMYIQTTAASNTSPTLNIVSPANNSTWLPGASVSFQATATDAEDGNIAADIEWISSLDGVIGAGGAFSTTALSEGTHVVTASVTDSSGKTASDSVSLTVGEPQTGPALNVEIVTDVSIYETGDVALIVIFVTDEDGQAVEGANVRAVMTTANGTVYIEERGVTDSLFGAVVIIHDINADVDGIGTYTVEATASKSGHQNGFGSTTFTVTQ